MSEADVVRLDYPTGFVVPSFEEQKKRTQEMFPELTLPDFIPSGNELEKLPEGWDGVWWFPPKISSLCDLLDDYGYARGIEEQIVRMEEKYGELFRTYFPEEAQSISGSNSSMEVIATYRCRLSKHGKLKRLQDHLLFEESQEGDFLKPQYFSFGKYYVGKSPNEMLLDALSNNYLIPGLFHLIALTRIMPERFGTFSNPQEISLGVLCIGDNAEEIFSRACVSLFDHSRKGLLYLSFFDTLDSVAHNGGALVCKEV